MNQVTGGSTVTFTKPQSKKNTSEPILYLRMRFKNSEPVQVQETLSREVVDVALNSLGKIIDFYRNERDPRSIQLIDWGLELLLADQFKERFDESYVKSFVKRIHFLSQKILINGVDTAPLKESEKEDQEDGEEPILVDGKIWPKWMWRDFNRCVPQTPNEVRTHRFLKEIVRWRNTLPIAEVNPTIEISDPDYKPLQAILPPNTSGMLDRKLCETNVDEVSRSLKTYTYCKLISTANQIKEYQAQQEEAIEGAEELRLLWEKARINIAQQTELAEKEAKEHTERLKQSLNNITQAHQQTVRILNGLIEEQRAYQRELTARIESNERRMSLQEGQIWQLRNQVANQWASIHHLSKKAKKKKRWF